MFSELKPYPEYKDSGVEWLGAVPGHWEVRRLGQIGPLSKGNGGNKDDEVPAGVPCVRYGDLYTTHTYFIHDTRSYIPAERSKDYTPIRFGDVLFAASGETIEEIGKSAVNLIRSEAYCGGDVIVFRPSRQVVAKFMGYATDCRPAAMQKARMGRGITVNHIYGSQLKRLVVPLPSLSEQTAIARFLDHAGQHIQRYIAAKQRLIALLEEQKRAVVHEVVTGQVEIRTGRRYRAYKDSGVDWLQEIPTHWEMRRSKRAFRPRTELAKPDDIQLSATQAYGVIAQEEFEHRAGRKVVRISRHLEQRRHVEIDDFVISMRSFQGGLERAWVSGCIRSSYIVLRPITTLDVGYFGYLFKSVGYISALQATANFIRDGQDLNFGNFCRVDVPFPPIGEQERIVEALDDVMERIALSIDHARRQIRLLTEYCTTLIADVVTGKVDVREAAAKLPRSDANDLDHDAGMDRDRTSVPDTAELNTECAETEA